MAAVYVWRKATSETSRIHDTEHAVLTPPSKIQSLQGAEIRNISCGENHTLVCLQNSTTLISDNRCITQDCGEGTLANFEPVTELPEANQVIEVAASSSHSVVLTQTHKVFTWGKNDCGQLGRKNVPEATQGIPRQVEFLAGHKVLKVACGNNHTLVLTDLSLVAAWGSNSYGQLGIGQHTSPYLNQPEFVSCLKGIPVAQVAAGGNHSFMLSTSGALYGWGRNDCGQLGVHDTQDHFLPKQCCNLRDKTVKFICCGENHTACLTLDGQAYTFGNNSHGQLGHSGNESMVSPELIEFGDRQISQIACGRNHTLVYVPASDSLYTFGLTGNGQLGHSDNKNIPVLVPALSPQEMNIQGTKLKCIYAGGDHSFVVVEEADTCEPTDFRMEDEERQILTLTNHKIEKILTCKRIDPTFKTLSREVKDIFSHASCLNGSFLAPRDDEQYGNSSKKHGVDLHKVQEFFRQLKESHKNPFIASISSGIKLLLPELPISPPDIEALRLYLVLPECHLFDLHKFYNSFICPLANSLLSLTDNCWKVLVKWWQSTYWSSFKRLIMIFKNLVTYLLKQPAGKSQDEKFKINAALHTSLEMLKKLYKVDELQNQSAFYKEFYVPEVSKRVIVNCSLNYSVQVYNQSQGFSFFDYMFVFDIETKYRCIEIESNKQMMKAAEEAQLHTFDILIRNELMPLQPFNPQGQYLILAVSSKNLFQDAHSQLQGRPVTDLKKPLKVLFTDQPTVFEGIMRKDFFPQVFQNVTSKESGFFKKKDNNLMWFAKKAEDKASMFQTIGILCGLTIYNSVLVSLPFPLVLYKKLLKRSVSLDDFEDFMPDQKRSFQSILKDDKVENLCLTFEYRYRELYPGGTDDEVTEENKKQFVDMTVDFILNKSVETQFSAFSKGFYSVCSDDVLESLHPKELEALLVGDGDYDFKILEKNAKYREEYNENHPTIKLFWQVVHEMTLEKKKQLLLFYSASDRIPVSGMESIELTIQPYPVELHLLPVAYTCHKLLSLPKYNTKEMMCERLHTAIGVKGFFLKA